MKIRLEFFALFCLKLFCFRFASQESPIFWWSQVRSFAKNRFCHLICQHFFPMYFTTFDANKWKLLIVSALNLVVNSHRLKTSIFLFSFIFIMKLNKITVITCILTKIELMQRHYSTLMSFNQTQNIFNQF